MRIEVFMHDAFAENGPLKLLIHDDGDTPLDFVRHLLRVVFGKSEREAVTIAAQIEDKYGIVCGPFPVQVAKALLEAAEQLIRDDEQPLRITTEAADAVRLCDLCETQRSVINIFLNDGRVPVHRLLACRQEEFGRAAGRRIKICRHRARLAFCRTATQPDRDAVAAVSRPHARRRPDRDRQAARRPDPFLRHP
ncbi:ATP-dependent Clp protease adaptor ClpS [Bradyrhizobium genosp. P]|uniref:ATP-dependent Clp protease adaptor ClpS n=1 Tax=Bradyrhizobium genosp. P TaxID=83641 RepID=UPI003CF1BE25